MDRTSSVKLGEALAEAEAHFGAEGFAPDRIAVTWLPEIGAPARHRGDAPTFPASVVKLFYLVALEAWLESGRLAPTPELARAARDMIVDSGNDATHLVLDALTGTTGGLELPPAEMADWQGRRNAVNRWFQTLGWPELATLNACQKTYAEGPYGREAVSRDGGRNSNRLTTDGTARLLASVIAGTVVTPARCEGMRGLLARDPRGFCDDPPDQVQGFLGEGLPGGARLWSKAGWTSKTRHDAAHVLLPDGSRHTLVVFTEGPDLAANPRLLPWLATRLLGPSP